MNTSVNNNDYKDETTFKMNLHSPNTPPYHRDRLFKVLTHGSSRRAAQMVPRYSEFRLGHGDPLMHAAMKHWQVTAHPQSTPERSLATTGLDVYVDKEIHLKEHGSPICGPGMNDVIHLNDDIITIPCLPLLEHLMQNVSGERKD